MRCRGVDGRDVVAESSLEGCDDGELLGINGVHRNRLTLIVDNGREGLRSTAALRAATLLVSASPSGALASHSSIVRVDFGC
jgi:hypothetical protein